MKLLYKTFSEQDCDKFREYLASQGFTPDIRYSQQISMGGRSVYYEYEFHVSLDEYLNAQSALRSYLKSQEDNVSKATKEFHKCILIAIVIFASTIAISFAAFNEINEITCSVAAALAGFSVVFPALLKKKKFSQPKNARDKSGKT